MTVKTIYFIHHPAPLLGRSPLQRGYFPYFLTEKYIKTLQQDIDRKKLPWKVIPDDTEADSEALMARQADLLVCAPGLRLQCYPRGFDKDNIIWLAVLAYVTADTSTVINRLNSLALSRHDE